MSFFLVDSKGCRAIPSYCGLWTAWLPECWPLTASELMACQQETYGPALTDAGKATVNAQFAQDVASYVANEWSGPPGDPANTSWLQMASLVVGAISLLLILRD